MIRRVVAEWSAALVARITRCVPMTYAAGADPSADRPAHVRAASGLAWFGERLAVVQDDANFIALVDPATGEAEAVPLPAGPDGARQFDAARGNKADKLAIETVVSIGSGEASLLLALGSGSTPLRENFAVVDRDGGVTMSRLARFYAALREATDFAGSELNVEGALHVGDVLRIFARGNGAARGELLPVNATCDVVWAALRAHLARPEATEAPLPHGIVQYDLGTIDGVMLGFTDAALVGDARASSPRVLYTAAAESSPDVVRDGPVAGSAIGIVTEDARGVRARWTELLGADGERLAAKIEGIAVVPGREDEAFVVVDRDDHERPSELCEVRLEGTWRTGTDP